MKKPTHITHTMKQELLFVGLHVHAKNITVALAEGGGGEARLYGTIPNDLHALVKTKGQVNHELVVPCRGGLDSIDCRKNLPERSGTRGSASLRLVGHAPAGPWSETTFGRRSKLHTLLQ